MFDEAQLLLHRMIDEKLLTAHGVVTLLPAQSDGDDILVYDKDGGEATAVLHGLRQQVNILLLLLQYCSSFVRVLAGGEGHRWCLPLPVRLCGSKAEWANGLCWNVCSHLWFGM